MAVAPPPLALPTDLAAFVGEEIGDSDARAVAVLRMAGSLVRAYTGQQWSDGQDVPDAAADVTVDVAARVWSNPDALVGDAIDDFRRQWSDRAADGFYLTSANKMVLDSLRSDAGSRRGLFTVGTTRGDDYLDTVYVPTGPPPSGYPFPWYAADDPMVFP